MPDDAVRKRAMRQLRQIMLDKGLRSPSWLAHSTDDEVLENAATWIRQFLTSGPVMDLFKWLREEFRDQWFDEAEIPHGMLPITIPVECHKCGEKLTFTVTKMDIVKEASDE